MKTLILAMALLLVGCSYDYNATVESNTNWSGSFNGVTIDGTGNRTIPLGDDTPLCCTVFKKTPNGFLSIQIVGEGGGIFIADSETEKKTTRGAYGGVSVCSR